MNLHVTCKFWLISYERNNLWWHYIYQVLKIQKKKRWRLFFPKKKDVHFYLLKLLRLKLKFCVTRVFMSFLFIVDGTMDDWVVRWLRTDCGLPEKREVTWSGRVSATRAPTSSLTWARMASLTSSTYLLVLEDAPIWS